MFLEIENFTTEMIAVCVIISIVAAFAYVYRKRVKDEYNGGLLRKEHAKEKETRKKQINPQGSKNDYLQLLSGIVTVARKKKWLLIAPAVIEIEGVYTQLIALIVTEQKIIAVCAFGHGGIMVAAPDLQDWTQRVNDTEQKIKSPLKTIQNAQTVLTKVTADLDITTRSIEVFGGFTHPQATLQGAANKMCYTTFDLLVYLQALPADAQTSEQTKEIIEKLRTVVLKPEKQKKK